MARAQDKPLGQTQIHSCLSCHNMGPILICHGAWCSVIWHGVVLSYGMVWYCHLARCGVIWHVVLSLYARWYTACIMQLHTAYSYGNNLFAAPDQPALLFPIWETLCSFYRFTYCKLFLILVSSLIINQLEPGEETTAGAMSAALVNRSLANVKIVS